MRANLFGIDMDGPARRRFMRTSDGWLAPHHRANPASPPFAKRSPLARVPGEKLCRGSQPGLSVAWELRCV
jgi:hypothetical protein